MLRIAKGEDSRSFFSMQTPLLAFMLLNAGMGALFLDLTHKLYVWRIYTTFQPTSPMSWGSWVLLLVYARAADLGPRSGCPKSGRGSASACRSCSDSRKRSSAARDG